MTYERDFGAFARDGTPIYVRVLKRVWFAADNAADDAIESREYSDGFGRTWQTRVQADEVTFGADGDDVGLLVAGEARPGAAGGPAEGGGPPAASSSAAGSARTTRDARSRSTSRSSTPAGRPRNRRSTASRSACGTTRAGAWSGW